MTGEILSESIRWAPQSEVERQKADALAERICRDNHLWQIGQGHHYRCQFCEKESLAILWVPQDKCPRCGRMYNAILAAESEE